jgi:hypothetical protein
MAEYLQAPPRRKALGLLADALTSGQEALNTVNLPYVGGLGGLLFGQAPQYLQDVSYGMPAFRGGNVATGGLGTLTPDTRMLDVATLPFVGAGAAKAGQVGAKTLGKEVARQVETGTGLLGSNVLDPRQYALPPAKYVGKTLEGMPDIVDVGGKLEQFGTDQRLVDIASDYAANRGLLYNPAERYAQVDIERAKRIANEYEKMANNPQALPTKKSYDALIDETQAQYEALKKAGYKFEFMPKSGDPYGNPRNAINDLVQNKHLYVFPTESGFGGTRAKEALKQNPLLKKTDETWNGKPVLANDMFRAVHDVFGHAQRGVGFRAGGEENAFQSHARMFSPEALPAATSETRGQNSWVNFGPYAELNKTASPISTQYAEQKTGLMPAWTWLEGLLR